MSETRTPAQVLREAADKFAAEPPYRYVPNLRFCVEPEGCYVSYPECLGHPGGYYEVFTRDHYVAELRRMADEMDGTS